MPIALMFSAGILGAHPGGHGESPSAADVIARIQAAVNCEWSPETVDTFKAGDPSTAVTGVAVTFMATQEVLERAAAAGCNLVITHEPTFYHHFDHIDGWENDPVQRAKKAFIRQAGLVIWRFHDHSHRHAPDLIYEGMIQALDLGEPDTDGRLVRWVHPEVTVGRLARILKQRLGGRSVDVVGDPEMKITRIALVAGAPGSLRQMEALRHPEVEVLLAGETREWETVPYVQDAAAQGMRKAMILLGHANSEEAGMEYVAEWLEGIVTEVPVKFIPAGDPFKDA